MKVKDIQQELDKLLKPRSPKTISELYRLHTYFADKLHITAKRNAGILFEQMVVKLNEL